MNILIADDNRIVISAIRSWLEIDDDVAIVEEVTNAYGLLAAVENVRPNILLLDWELQGMQTDGVRSEIMQALQASCPRLRIVALSSHPELKQHALDSGVDAFVSKAEPPDPLHTMIAEWREEIATEQPFD